MMQLSPEKNNASAGAVRLQEYPLVLLVVPAIVLLTYILYSVLQTPEFINYDCAYYLLCARLMLEGGKPFQDFVDLLPPLIFYLSVPPLSVTQLFSMPVALGWNLIVWSSIALSFVASLLVVRNIRDIDFQEWLLLGPMFCAFLTFNLVVGFHFGQREHFFILALFPLYLIRWLRWTNPSTQVSKYLAALCGFACALTGFVKPQFLIVPILVELYFWRSQGHRIRWQAQIKTAETVSLVATLIACFLVSFLIPNIQAYYSRWVPFISEGYGAFYSPPANLFLISSPDGNMLGSRFIAAIICISAYFLRGRSVLQTSLLVWTVAGFVLYLLQGRGWSYQSIPAICGYFLLASVMIAKLATWCLAVLSQSRASLEQLNPGSASLLSGDGATEIRKQIATIVFLGYGLLLIPLSTVLVHNSHGNARVFNTLDGLIASETKPKDTVLILHTMFPHAHQLQLQKDLRPGSRYIWCFPLRMTAYLKRQAGKRERAAVEEQKIIAEIVQDIQKSKPKIIFIEAFASDLGGWSLYKSLLSSTFISRALSDYEPCGEYERFAVWKLKETNDRNQLIRGSL